MTRTSPARRARTRRAHTLTELLVVLTILALVAGIALPRVAAAVLRSRLETARDTLRADLLYARARAAASGLRHQVTFDPETRELRVEPFRPELLDATGAAAPAPDPELYPPALTDRLPEGIRVSTWSVAPVGPLGDPVGGRAANAALPANGVDGAPLVFYPEGRADDALIVLENDTNERAGLRVDGFTGEIRELEPDELP